jgi:hypothetical protein
MQRSPSGCLSVAGVASALSIGVAQAQTPPPAHRLTWRMHASI